MSILNGIHNYKIEQRLDTHLLAGILREKDKKKVADMTKSLVQPRN